MKTKKTNYDHLPEPSRSIAIRADKHIRKCFEIELTEGKEEAQRYHKLHKYDGTFKSKDEKEAGLN